jgi:NIMA (never in mitosis gene a)-related kinase 2
VFLDSDNNVKLGDFGLSKIIQSHDFASTYVGTPYYMSPEVCGAERYSTASDIWSLGCLIYELCTWSPPFNARSHVELFSKIKMGKYTPLPPVYSSELSKVVSSCLQVNPNLRPDGARLLGLPMVSVMRKQIEAVQTHKALKLEIEGLRKKEADLKKKEEEMNHKLQMEWEVRAQLEINKYVQAEKDRLEGIFEEEVNKRVGERVKAMEPTDSRRSSGEQSLGGKTLVDGNSSSGESQPKQQHQQQQPIIESGISFDVAKLTLDSPSMTLPAPLSQPHQNLASAIAERDRSMRRRSRTPFVRAQTSLVPQLASPMDITMGEPSPMSIASLSLSPRKDNVSTVTGTQRRVSGNIFANAHARRGSQRWQAMNISPPASEFGETELAASFGADDDENEILTKSPSHREPSKRAKRISMLPGREGLGNKRLTSAPALSSGLPAPVVNGQIKRPMSAVPVVSTSPSRQIKTSKAMESPIRNSAIKQYNNNNAKDGGGSPVRKIVSTFRSKRGGVDAEAAGVIRGAVRAGQNGVTGRTLVELAQARAGGIDRTAAFTNTMASKGMVQESIAAVWDPERDEMPSPFLARGRNALRAALR